MLYSFRNKKPRIGDDTYVSEHALVIGDVRIGDNCYIGHGAILRGDYGSIEVDSRTAIEEGVVMHAPPTEICRVGKKVTIGHGAIIHSSSIGDGCLIGMGAILSIHSEIGNGTIIAEGSVVTMNQKIPDGVVAAGGPARILRQVKDKSNPIDEVRSQLYEDLAKEYLRDGMQRVDLTNGPE
jgi:carbonic anhydrase/acetyltransferase-like protein (isoleucine patch superfamily)